MGGGGEGGGGGGGGGGRGGAGAGGAPPPPPPPPPRATPDRQVTIRIMMTSANSVAPSMKAARMMPAVWMFPAISG
jgi:hypothetical protein